MQKSFLDLLEVHGRLGRAFEEFQYALLDQDLELAERRLKRFRHDLLRHMRHEEEVLIPIYEKGPIQPGGKVEYFQAEHRKLLELLEELKAGLETAARAAKDEFHHALLVVVDAACHYVHFTEHHEMREERYLFPALDALVPEDERADLIAAVPA